MAETMHRPAAAWSRDALTAWQYVFERTDPKKDDRGDPTHCHYEFMRRWAIKTVNLVNEEMGFCDWYWFLDSYFNEKLAQLNSYHKPLRDSMFRNPSTRETDPATKEVPDAK